MRRNVLCFMCKEVVDEITTMDNRTGDYFCGIECVRSYIKTHSIEHLDFEEVLMVE